jgi:hypothetical protein
MKPCQRASLLVPLAALLCWLTVGPAPSWAQSPFDEAWGSSDDAFPLWRVRGEYLGWWTNGNPLPPLVTTSPLGTSVTEAGVLGTSGAEVVFGGRNIDTGVRSGGRVTISLWLEDDELAFDFVGFYVGDDYQSGNFVAQSAGSPILARPFLNASSNLEDSELVAFPGRLAGRVTVASYSEAYSAAGLLRHRYADFAGAGRLDWLAGYRYFRFREDLAIRENLIATDPGGLVQKDTTFDVRDRFTVGNDFHGGELGVACEWLWSTISVELIAKVALGGLFRQAIVSGNTVVTIPGLPSDTTAGGLLALPTNIGARSNAGIGFLPELDLNTTVLLTPRLSLVGGYTLVVLNDVLRSGRQIDRVVNISQLGGEPLQGQARPAFSFDHSALVVQGLSIGLDYRW